MSLTVADFLEPWVVDAEELRHTLADSARSTSVDRRYEVLGQTQPWHSFNSYDIRSAPVLRHSLETEFIPRWQAWMSDVSRVIYSERMLENLYSSTLITRVNIALQHVIPSGDRCITIITCPGAFDSHDPDVKGGKRTVILPDWIALEGEYKPHDDSFPNLEELAFSGKVIAVGDTKLVSRRLASSGVDEKIKDTIAGTHSCHRSYLAQVQHYAKMLRTRFGFVLTNKELVLAQFLREEEPAPRLHDQRGLRSSTGPPLHLGLSSDFRSSSAEEMDESPVDELSPFYLSQPKRRHDSSDNPTLSRRSPAPVDPSEDQNIDGLPSTPSAPPTVVDDLPSSPPRPSQAVEQPMPKKLVSTPAQNSPQPLLPMHITTSPIQPNVLVGSPFGFLSSEPSFPQSSGTPYLSSERDHDIGKVLVKSFRIPNPCDKDEVRITKELHPAKALFVMLMHASSVGALGRRIGKEEVLFGGQSREDE
ncbi:uncharacterized protein N7446_004012 [Penicillium canescens]|uniref:Uncharacterized protein n=1 Tax=Penicillium canescens TaxID=5083 RepID=A0AAD6I234_PENCN|nr:uncharacterized protein N7446_004012 [Penicillium canescens]KAJ6027392.1 hypothetical protein N7460_012209 [Penicillium canescens]KAJ6040673.1 hypothetical protein N7444_009578 [Penicillium canescens]KAJ6066975.1 hypothetical protein N7446_004012 [Penicillium canescens]